MDGAAEKHEVPVTADDVIRCIKYFLDREKISQEEYDTMVQYTIDNFYREGA